MFYFVSDYNTFMMSFIPTACLRTYTLSSTIYPLTLWKNCYFVVGTVGGLMHP
jgi:hypothetical protein